jgi:TonB family protein
VNRRKLSEFFAIAALTLAANAGAKTSPSDPASRDGIVVDAWVTMPIVWKLQDSKGHNIPPLVVDGTARPIPSLARDQALNLDPPYDPRSAADQRLEAICGVHARISADGVVASLRIEHSSGSAALDQASMDALYAANLLPRKKTARESQRRVTSGWPGDCSDRESRNENNAAENRGCDAGLGPS